MIKIENVGRKKERNIEDVDWGPVSSKKRKNVEQYAAFIVKRLNLLKINIDL